MPQTIPPFGNEAGLELRPGQVDFVLVVEKDCTFQAVGACATDQQQLIDDGFLRAHACVLVTVRCP
jgi:hypothetical protein